jgi:DNA-binding response OmpR family regulator
MPKKVDPEAQKTAPAPAGSEKSASTDPGKTASTNPGKKILIVEDEKPLAHALELKLTHEGYSVHVEMTGAAGLKEALTGQYGLILLDLIMPEIDGFAVLQGMKDKGVTTPTVVLSNLGQDEDRQRALGLGAKGYFVKANTPIVEIVKTVHTLI